MEDDEASGFWPPLVPVPLDTSPPLDPPELPLLFWELAHVHSVLFWAADDDVVVEGASMGEGDLEDPSVCR